MSQAEQQVNVAEISQEQLQSLVIPTTETLPTKSERRKNKEKLKEDMRRWVLLKKNSDGKFVKENHFYNVKSPRSAAEKAATRGIEDIYLLEMSENKNAKRKRNKLSIHHYQGSRQEIDHDAIKRKYLQQLSENPETKFPHALIIRAKYKPHVKSQGTIPVEDLDLLPRYMKKIYKERLAKKNRAARASTKKATAVKPAIKKKTPAKNVKKENAAVKKSRNKAAASPSATNKKVASKKNDTTAEVVPKKKTVAKRKKTSEPEETVDNATEMTVEEPKPKRMRKAAKPPAPEVEGKPAKKKADKPSVEKKADKPSVEKKADKPSVEKKTSKPPVEKKPPASKESPKKAQKTAEEVKEPKQKKLASRKQQASSAGQPEDTDKMVDE